MAIIIKSRAEALCYHTGWDTEDIRHHRYHPYYTSIPVWATDNAYYCVTKGSEKPATHRDGGEWAWERVHDAFVDQSQWKIWKASTQIV